MEIQREWLEKIIRIVIEEVQKVLDEPRIPLGVSNRHLHLSREDMDLLFGKGSELTKLKDLRQPGQYAAKETVTVRGPKGELHKVRILGPLRENTQLELSVTDSFAIGIKAMVRESGKIDGTPGFEMIGPAGNVQKSEGAIVAMRHIHLSPDVADRLGVQDKQIVRTEVGSERKTIFDDVLIRVSDQYLPEMHLDMDEANACLGKNGDLVKIIPREESKAAEFSSKETKEAPVKKDSISVTESMFGEDGQKIEVLQKVISAQTVLANCRYRTIEVRSDSIVTALALEEASKRGIKIEKRR